MSNLFGDILYSNFPPTAAPNTGAIAHTDTPTAGLTGVLIAGARTSTQPVDEQPRALSGAMFSGANDALYDRILITPTRVDYGNIISAQQQVVRVWNAFGTDKSVTAFSLTPNQGVTVSPPAAVPYDLDAYQEVSYIFDVSETGSPTLSAEAVLTIDGQDYVVEFIGTRLVLWPFEPNWSDGLNETLAYRTNIIQAYDGSEQRIAVRVKPRRSVEYEYHAVGRSAAMLDNTLYGWQNRNFAVPVWPEASRLAAPAIAGDEVVYLDTTDRGFRAGEPFVIRLSDTQLESQTIGEVFSDRLELTGPLRYDWPFGAPIYPAMIAHLPASVSRTKQTDSAITARAVFDVVPQQTDSFVPDDAATDTYAGYEIILIQPNWAGGLDASHGFEFDSTDDDIGPVDYFVTHALSRPMRKFSWTLANLSEVARFRAFLGRLRGQQRAVYIPTWQPDFVLTAAIGSGATSITTEDNGYARFKPVSPGRDHLMIRLVNGQTYLREITAAVGAAGTATISLTGGALPVVSVAEVALICLVNLYRAGSDDTTIQWRSAGVAQIDINFIQVPA